MRAVAEGGRLGFLAGTPGHLLAGGNIDLKRCKPRSLVGAITERLFPGSTACTPPIRAGIGILHNGRFLKYYGFSHIIILMSSNWVIL